MDVHQIGARLVELCTAGNHAGCLDELYHEDAVSVEAMAMPGSGQCLAMLLKQRSMEGQ